MGFGFKCYLTHKHTHRHTLTYFPQEKTNDGNNSEDYVHSKQLVALHGVIRHRRSDRRTERCFSNSPRWWLDHIICHHAPPFSPVYCDVTKDFHSALTLSKTCYSVQKTLFTLLWQFTAMSSPTCMSVLSGCISQVISVSLWWSIVYLLP